MAQVNEYTVDLSVARDRFEIVSRQAEITDVYIAELAAGTRDVVLIFGLSSPNGFRNIYETQSFECCPHERDGLYVSCPAVGGQLRVAVTFADRDGNGGAAARGG